MKKKQTALSFLIFVLLLLSYSFSSVNTKAESVVGVPAEDAELFQVVEKVDIEEESVILEGTYVYGNEKQEGVKVEHLNTYIIIPYKKVRKVSNDTGNIKGNDEILEEYQNEKANRIPQEDKVDNNRQSSEKDSLNTLPEEKQDFEKTGEENTDGSKEEKSAKNNSEQEAAFPTEESSSDNSQADNENEEVSLEEPSKNIELENQNDTKRENQNSKEVADDEEGNSDQLAKTESYDEKLSQVDEEVKKEAQDELNSSQHEKKTEEEAMKKASKAVLATDSVSTVNSKVNPWNGVSSNYFKVTTDNLVVYDNRGNGPLKPVGKLKKGQVYHRISDCGNWHGIQYGNIYGYVRKADTTPANESSLKYKNTSYKNKKRTFQALKDVEIYDNSSGSLVPFGTINKDEAYPIATDYGQWWRVLLADRVGYVNKSDVKAEFFKSDKYFRVYKEDLPVYDNREQGPLKKVGELKKGQSYSIESDYGNWWRVQYGDIYGYVHKAD